MAQHGYLREYDEGRDRGEDRDRDRGEWRERGFLFGDDDSDRFREHDHRADRSAFENNSDWPQREHGFGGREWNEGRSYSANPDDHYRSWRNRQMQSLDRDYEDYCREREQQFHRDFDQWRSQRYGNPGPLRTAMTQTGLSADPTGMTQAASETQPAEASEPDPMGTATLGANTKRRGP
ncbi:MAG TPA: hypothetical protein VNS11_03140 [Sphingomicrobium sp.]|nr:hypothetical protein [Sphingomicrobium sp.]